jgi:putative spermidine/putrescine transport system permease protein
VADRLRPKALTSAVNKWAWFTSPVIFFLAIFFVYPLLEVFRRSVADPTLSLRNYTEFFGTEVYVEVLLNTLKMAVIVTVVCLLLAYPYAYLMNKVSQHIAGLMLVAVLVPFWTSILVRTYAWTVILQDTGIINSILLGIGIIDEPLTLMRNFLGVVIGMVHILLPFMVLPLYAVMRRIDIDYMRAAANLGASPFEAFWRVFLPLSLPGVFAGVLLVFVIALGFYITPALLGSPENIMLSELVVQQVQQLFDWGMGSAMAFILLIVTLIILAATSRIIKLGEALGEGDET